MITETSEKTELLDKIREAFSSLRELMMSLDETEVNAVPYEDSWTAAQLFRHVAKSTDGLASVIAEDGRPAGRDVGERIPDIKNTFLNFSIRMKSPEFIVPEARTYEKQAITGELDHSFEKLEENAAPINVDEMLDIPPLGAMTKLEMLHFVLYHTQRHLHQMTKICNALKALNEKSS